MIDQLPARGFTLVETVIATAFLITAIAGLAQLLTLSARFVRDSNRSGAALVAAQDKLEMLTALRFGYDADGRPGTDARLHPSRPTSLHENVDSYFEWLTLEGSIGAQRDASFLRRWRISEIASNEPAAIAIEVCVYTTRSLGVRPDDAAACVGTVRVRQP